MYRLLPDLQAFFNAFMPRMALAGPHLASSTGFASKTVNVVKPVERVKPATFETQPVTVPQSSEVEAPVLLSEAELIEMKRICALNGEAWRLRMIEAFEQATASIQFMYSNPAARARMEAQLLEDLLRELGDYEAD